MSVNVARSAPSQGVFADLDLSASGSVYLDRILAASSDPAGIKISEDNIH